MYMGAPVGEDISVEIIYHKFFFQRESNLGSKYDLTGMGIIMLSTQYVYS